MYLNHTFLTDMFRPLLRSSYYYYYKIIIIIIIITIIQRYKYG